MKALRIGLAIAAGVGLLWGGLLYSAPKAKWKKNGAFDFTAVERKLDLSKSGIEGNVAFAGAALHRDANKVPVVTWIALVLDDTGRANKMYIDMDNNGKITDKEGFDETTPDEQKKNNNGKYSSFDLDSVTIGGVKHAKFQLMAPGSPVEFGFYLSMNVEGNAKNYMRAGWNPANSKVSKMSTDLEKAPIFDFILAGDLLIHGQPFILPVEGKGEIMYTLMTAGADKNSATQIGMNRIPQNDIKVELTYPLGKDRYDIWKANINHVC